MINFVVYFEIASIMFLSFLCAYFFLTNRLWNASMRVYGAYLVITFLDMLLNILSVTYNGSELLNGAYLFMQACMPPVYAMYILLLSGLIKRDNAKYVCFVVSLPAVCVMFLILINHWTGVIFTVSNGEYAHGPLHLLIYVNAALYVFAAFAITVIWRRNLGRQKLRAIHGITAVMSALMIVQYLKPEMLLTGTGIVLGQYLMYFSFQNPTDYIDTLTTLLNREALTLRFNETRAGKSRLKLIVMSMRGFKEINDAFGVSSGDMLLKTIGTKLTNECGRGNTYRISGDVFVAALKDGVDSEEMLNNIKDEFLKPWDIGGVLISARLDLCVIDAKNSMDNVDDIIKLIEYSIREMKKRRDDKWLIVDDALANEMQRRVDIEKGLMNAIADENLEMYYQPIYNIKEGKFTSFEALARLKLNGIGYIPPEEFILIAEENGQIMRLGEVALRSVCRFIRDFKPQRFGVKFAQINLSMMQCMDIAFAEKCESALKEFGVKPENIYLEITETAASSSDKTLLMNMQRLSGIGVRFSLDDYGAGYSTADYAMRMPFSQIKIDHNIVSSARNDERKRLFMLTLIEMFKKIGFDIVAEGIESKDDEDCLLSTGADLLQGYYLSVPLSEKDYMRFISENTK